MAEGNIGTLIQGMKEFDKSYGTSHSKDWYNAMVWWGSLSRSTDDWINLNASTKAKYTDIQNNGSNYMNYLEAKATFKGGRTAVNKAKMNTAKKAVDWKMYNKTRNRK